MATETILLVEDEQSISKLVKLYLESEGFQVLVASDGATGLRLYQEQHPDLIVLDLLLPEIDGLAICRSVRHQSATPILMLTAKRSEADKIAGLELGADDYLTKPFSPREMVTRVKAILRRTRHAHVAPNVPQIVRLDDLYVDVARREVSVRGSPVELTNKEFELLRTLASSPGIVFSRDALLTQVWGADYYGDARTVDVHVGTLRKKIELSASSPRYIKTVWGVGYKIDDHPNS